MYCFFISGAVGGDVGDEDCPRRSFRSRDDDHQSARKQRRGLRRDGQLVQVSPGREHNSSVLPFFLNKNEENKNVCVRRLCFVYYVPGRISSKLSPLEAAFVETSCVVTGIPIIVSSPTHAVGVADTVAFFIANCSPLKEGYLLWNRLCLFRLSLCLSVCLSVCFRLFRRSVCFSCFDFFCGFVCSSVSTACFRSFCLAVYVLVC